ncbi:flavin reductase family protein [Caldimonas brevitalea]|nr:flavin reductase family protein [Caldimonas brevitalea]
MLETIEERAEYVPCVDADRFRAAMRKVVSAVHIITTGGPAGRAGFTASAVTALSDQPASLLVCMNRRTATAGLFLANAQFCVNTLCAGDGALADEFGGKGGAGGRNLTGPRWREGWRGLPALQAAAIAHHCLLVKALEYGTHYLLIGRVVDIDGDPADAMLAYINRRYESIDLAGS